MDEENGQRENSQGRASERTEGRKISKKRLQENLEAHQKWLESGKKGGSGDYLFRANLQGADLEEANLQEANLWGTNLRGAYLFRANLQGADLGEANLQGARLVGANLQGARLLETKLRGADLSEANLREATFSDADLTDTRGLLGGQLAGTDVSGAKLPDDIRKFEDGLKVVEEASRNARKLFFAMLSACAYALLTIATTTDVRLLTNSASSPLPIIRTEIPIVWFYIAAPLILLCLYFYFHLYMQRLWEGLAKLPAVFPDGRSLDEKAYPWLLTGLVRAHVLHLREERPPLSYLQEWISIALAWWFMPGTLICFWLRYIPRQDWFGTAFHIALLVVAFWAGVLFYRLAVGTLRLNESELSLWKKPFKKIMTYKRGVMAIRLGLILFLLSLGTINGVPKFQFKDVRTWIPYVFDHIGFSPFANFREKDVSTKPANWSGKEEEISQVKGAPLRGRNLRYIQAYRAFLVNANLRWADLKGANLGWADLQGAKLINADLQKADLMGANLQKADLLKANLEEAYLGGTNLQGADLTGAINLTVEQLSLVGTLYQAKLDQELLEQIEKDYAHLRWKPKAKE